jgi:hypothetical protein
MKRRSTQRSRHREAASLPSGPCARGFAGGPLLLIVVGIMALLAWRYLPWQGWLVVPDDAAVQGDRTAEVAAGPELTAPAEAAVTGGVAAAPSRPAQPQVTPRPAAPLEESPTAEAREAAAPSRPAVPAKTQGPAPLPPVPVAIPNLKVFVEADVHERAGLSAYSADSYAGVLRRELERVVASHLGGDALQAGGDNLGFREAFAEDPQRAPAEVCEGAGSRRVLLADLTIPSAGFSAVDSAYWPEVAFRAISCGDGRQHRRPKARLEPHRQDGFPFQHHFAERAEGFVASQAYFLQP